MGDEISLKGIVERLIFIAPDSDFLVFTIRTDSEKKIVTVAGHMEKPLVGDSLCIQGTWTEHKKYGRQWAGTSWQRQQANSKENILRFLSSGEVTGIGPELAKRMVDAFDLQTMDIVQNDPDKLLQIQGIGIKKVAQIKSCIGSKKILHQVAWDMESHGISGRYAGRLIQHYGEKALTVLTTDPYRLMQDIDGIGFKMADQIALAYGGAENSEKRFYAALVYVLWNRTRKGHICLPRSVVLKDGGDLLQVPPQVLQEPLADLLQQGLLKSDDYRNEQYIYTVHQYDEECTIAERVREMTATRVDRDRHAIHACLKSWQETYQFTLDPKQREAVISSLQSQIQIITGGPGTGKTTVIRAIIQVAEQEGLRILLCAPTGRAAKRLRETTGREAYTIHRLLGANGVTGGKQIFEYNEDKQLPADMVIVDEVSMLDMELCYHLFQALPDSCRCVLVGDAEQLPAVGAGAVLHDFLHSRMVPSVRLNTIFRQKEGGRIVTNAHLIRSGRVPVCNQEEEFQFIEIDSEENGARKIADLYGQERQRVEDIFHIQVLAPMYKNFCGVDNLNRLIQAQYNPSAVNRPEYIQGDSCYRIGDKVMQKQNNYDKGVFNGDIGEIWAIHDDKIFVRYAERDVTYTKDEINEITLAYAVTVHKSQGSEYHTVILSLVNSHFIMLQRNLLYTAVTRAKQKVIIVGQKKALQQAVLNAKTNRRCTLLAARLQVEGLWG